MRSVPIAILALLLIPSLAGVVPAFEPGPREARLVTAEVLVAPGALTHSVAEDLERVATLGHLRLARHDVATAPALLERVSASRADLLMIVAHGDADGLAIGAGRATREDLLAAIAKTEARQVFFLACDLELPETVGAAAVHSAGAAVDARVATIEAIETWSQLYYDRDIIVQAFLPVFEDVLARIGGRQGFGLRLFDPVEPLSYTDPAGYDPYYYPCFRPPSDKTGYHCSEHAAEEDEQVHQTAQTSAYGTSFSDGPLGMGLDYLEHIGFLTKHENYNGFFRDWRVLYKFHFQMPDGKCVPLVGLQDLAVPGYTLRQMQYSLASGKVGTGFDKSIDADVLRLRVCATMYAGILESGRIGGGAQLKGQLGTEFIVSFKLGSGIFSIDFSLAFGAWLVMTGTGTVSGHMQAGRPIIDVDFSFTVDFVVEGNLGWLYGGFTANLYGPKHWGWQLDPFAPNAPNSAGADRINVLALTDMQLRGIARDPERARVLEERMGVPLASIPAGTVVDLSDPTFHELFVAPGTPLLPTTDRLPNGFLLGDHVRPRAGGIGNLQIVGCGVTLDVPALNVCAEVQQPTDDGSGNPTCTPSLRSASPLNPDAIVCVDQGADGTPRGASAEFTGGGQNINDTVAPGIDAARAVADPFCRQLLPGPTPVPLPASGSLPGLKGDCPYTYPANLCGWSINRAFGAMGADESGLANDVCGRYQGFVAGEAFAGDKKYYFDVGTTLLELEIAGHSLMVELCDAVPEVETPDVSGAAGIVPGCWQDAMGFDAPTEEPVPYDAHQYVSRQLLQYYSAAWRAEDTANQIQRWCGQLAFLDPGGCG